MTLRAVRVELAEIVADVLPESFTVYDTDVASPALPAAVVTWSDAISFTNRQMADGTIVFPLVVRFMFGTADAAMASNSVDDVLSLQLPAAILTHEGVSWRTAHATLIRPPELGPNSSVMVELVVEIRSNIQPIPTP